MQESTITYSQQLKIEGLNYRLFFKIFLSKIRHSESQSIYSQFNISCLTKVVENLVAFLFIFDKNQYDTPRQFQGKCIIVGNLMEHLTLHAIYMHSALQDYP